LAGGVPRDRADGGAGSRGAGRRGVGRAGADRGASAGGEAAEAAAPARAAHPDDRRAGGAAARPSVRGAGRRSPGAAARRAPGLPVAPAAAGYLGAPDAGVHGLLRPAGRGRGDRVPCGPRGVGGAAMIEKSYDVVIIGSGAGGGTVAQALGPLARDGLRVLVVEQGPRLQDHEFTGRELDMADSLYEDGGGFLTADGTMTLAFGRVYGGSTVVSTGTSLIAPERVIRRWGVPGLS